MSRPELWDWSRARYYDPVRAGKDNILLLRLGFWLCIWFILGLGAWFLFTLVSSHFKPRPPTPDVITATTANVDKKAQNTNCGPFSVLFGSCGGQS